MLPEVVSSRVSTRPNLQILYQAERACQGQKLSAYLASLSVTKKKVL
jgi:hypothetical protein